MFVHRNLEYIYFYIDEYTRYFISLYCKVLGQAHPGEEQKLSGTFQVTIPITILSRLNQEADQPYLNHHGIQAIVVNLGT